MGSSDSMVSWKNIRTFKSVPLFNVVASKYSRYSSLWILHMISVSRFPLTLFSLRGWISPFIFHEIANSLSSGAMRTHQACKEFSVHWQCEPHKLLILPLLEISRTRLCFHFHPNKRIAARHKKTGPIISKNS